jgi:hypothetical protein
MALDYNENFAYYTNQYDFRGDTYAKEMVSGVEGTIATSSASKAYVSFDAFCHKYI